MKKSIFYLALGAALITPISLSAISNNTDSTEMHQRQSNQFDLFSNIQLTALQQEQISQLENPFADIIEQSLNSSDSKAMPDRCGGDPRFQSDNPLLQLVLDMQYQRLVDARIAYLEKLGEILSEEQYDQFIKNLDSIGKVK